MRKDGKMSDKLYEVKTRFTPSFIGTDHSTFYVVADNPDTAYQMVQHHLEQRNIGTWNDREMESVTLLAEETIHPNCQTVLLTGEDLIGEE